MESKTDLAIINNEIINRYDFKGDYFKSFINYLDTSPKTIESYKGALKVFEMYLNERAINKPNRQDIINYRTTLYDRGLKNTTIRAYLNSVRKFFEWLNYNGLYMDIARNIKTIRVSNDIHRKDSLTLSQAQELLNVYKGDSLEHKRNYAIILLSLVCGLRVIEIARADIKDLTSKGGERILYIMGKGRTEKDRFNLITPNLDKAIRDYLIMRNPLNDNEPLFSSLSDRNKGMRLTAHSVSRIILNALKKIGVKSERITPHSLRHFTATENILLGGTREETQELLRHANPSTTEIYITPMNRLKNKSELRIEKALYNI